MKNTHANILTEGLREGDLADLVLPLVSVDEYESTIDSTEAIVLGFYVHDESAARDLNRFLQKSAVPLLGTDVSPAPDQHGFFLVFVEMMKNERLTDNLDAILHEMSTLVDIDEWEMRVRGNDGLVPYSAEKLMAALEHAKKAPKKTEVVEFLQHSALSNAEYDAPLLIIEGAGDRFCFDVIGFAETDALLQQHNLTEQAIRYDVRTIARRNKLVRVLGEQWEVSDLGGVLLLQQADDTRALLVRP